MLSASRTGSFSAAAEELGVTHGTISRRISIVERWLGAEVFERQARGVSLTPAGRRFVAQTDQALATIGQTAEQWRPSTGIASIRVSVVPSFAKLWLLPRLVRLQGEPMDLRVDLILEHRLSDLAAAESEIAIRYGQGNWPGSAAHKLFDEMLVPAAAPALVRRIGKRGRPEKIASLPLLHDSNTGQWRAWFARSGIRYAPRPIDRKFEDYDMVLAAAEAGLGAVLIRMPLATDYLARSDRLQTFDTAVMPNPAAHFAVLRADERRPTVLRFLERLIAET